MLAIVLMLVGIGFVAVLTGAVAERFIATQVRAEVIAAEEQLSDDVLDAEATVLAEIRRGGAPRPRS